MHAKAPTLDSSAVLCSDLSRVLGSLARGQECLVYGPSFQQDCLDNCTNAARVSCTNFTDPSQQVDIVHHCNGTCIHLYIDPASLLVTNASRSGDELLDPLFAYEAPPPPPPPVPEGQEGNLNFAYDGCMDVCQGNFTTDPQYLCDGASKRIVSLEEAERYYEAAAEGMGAQGITPQEQMEIDRLFAEVPKGEMCYMVDLECVANATLSCDSDCAELVAYYHQLCVFRYEVRRNATFEYNISSCIHPDGWRIGSEKWRYYFAENETSPLALPSAHRGDPLWQYDDVEDATILNCTCTFFNESFDPHFVAAVLEYDAAAER